MSIFGYFERAGQPVRAPEPKKWKYVRCPGSRERILVEDTGSEAGIRVSSRWDGEFARVDRYDPVLRWHLGLDK